MKQLRMRTTAVAVAMLASALLVAACGGSSGGSADAVAPSSGKVDPAARALLPADLRKAGVITVAVDPTFPPANFLDGTTVVGYMPDVLAAIGDALGVKIKYVQTTFDGILTGLQGNRYNTGIIFNDNPQRYSVVSTIDVVNVGEAFVVRSDSSEQGPTLSCGKSVGIGAGATNDIDIAKKLSKDSCVSKGQAAINIKIFPNNDQAITALTANRVDSVLSSADNLSYIIGKSGGKLRFLGDALNKQYAGVVVPTGNDALTKALTAGFQKTIENGDYAAVMKKWGTGILAVDAAKVNAAGS